MQWRHACVFLLIGTVEILERLEFFGRINCCAQVICQLALLLDVRKDFLLAFDEITKIRQTLFYAAQQFIFNGACCLLAVTCDKGNRIAVVEKCDDGFHLFGMNGQFFCYGCGNIGNAHAVQPFSI